MAESRAWKLDRVQVRSINIYIQSSSHVGLSIRVAVGILDVSSDENLIPYVQDAD